MSQPSSQTSNLLPLGATPLKSAASTGLIQQQSPVVLTSQGQRVGLNSLARSSGASYGNAGIPGFVSQTSATYSQRGIPPPRRGSSGNGGVFPPSPRSSRMSSPRSAPVADNVMTQLVSLGYSPIKSVLVNGQDGEEARYLEAITPIGSKVYIKLDTEGEVAVNPTDLTTIERKTATKVPLSYRDGMMESAGLGVDGILIVCDDELCVATRTDDGGVVEETLEIVEANSSKAIVEEGKTHAHPVINMSHILANPSQALLNIDDASRRMRNASYQNCRANIQGFRDAITNVTNAFNNFINISNATSQKLFNVIDELERYYVMYQKNPPTTPENLQKYQSLQATMEVRNRDINRFLEGCDKVTCARKELDKMTNILVEKTNEIQKQFTDIEQAVRITR